MRALRLNNWKTTPVVEETPEPTPGPGQVVIKVGGAGACHSDLHLMHDFDPGVVPWNPPFTLGHENAGWVHAVGAGVTIEPGRAVAVYGPWGCGRCRRCQLGIETYCENPQAAPVPGGGGGLGLDGGMAEYMLVPHERFLFPLPDGLDPVHAAPLTDAGLTPFHAVRRSWPKLTPTATAVVIGVGGLGHLAVQIIKATTAARVIAVDLRPEALELARSMGADEVVPSGDGAPAAIREATRGLGVDVVIDCVGAQPTVELARQVVRPMGDVTLVGIGGGTLGVSFFGIPYEASVQTTYWGTRPELAEVLDLGSRQMITPKISTFGLDEAVEVYDRMAAGKLEGRAVFVPNP
jgi:propanol-preferring alcohol dehydrogenase